MTSNKKGKFVVTDLDAERQCYPSLQVLNLVR
jgi:hypothetical protein